MDHTQPIDSGELLRTRPVRTLNSRVSRQDLVGLRARQVSQCCQPVPPSAQAGLATATRSATFGLVMPPKAALEVWTFLGTLPPVRGSQRLQTQRLDDHNFICRSVVIGAERLQHRVAHEESLDALAVPSVGPSHRYPCPRVPAFPPPLLPGPGLTGAGIGASPDEASGLTNPHASRLAPFQCPMWSRPVLQLFRCSLLSVIGCGAPIGGRPHEAQLAPQPQARGVYCLPSPMAPGEPCRELWGFGFHRFP